MNLRHVFLVVVFLMVPCVAIQADEAKSDNIDKLMGLFAYDAVLQKSLTILERDPRFAQIPDATKNCIRDVMNNQLRGEMYNSYLQLFPDPQIQQETIDFLESKAGRKLIGTVVDSMQDSGSLSQMVQAGRNTKFAMTKEEISIEKFSKTRGGQAFLAAPAFLEKRKSEIAPRLIQLCVSKKQG